MERGPTMMAARISQHWDPVHLGSWFQALQPGVQSAEIHIWRYVIQPVPVPPAQPSIAGEATQQALTLGWPEATRFSALAR